MSKNYVFVPGLFALGIIVGVVVMNSRDNSAPDLPLPSPGSNDEAAVEPVEPPTASETWFFSNAADDEHIKALEDKVAELEARIIGLETAIKKSSTSEESSTPPLRADLRLQNMGFEASKNSLVKAGVNEIMAAEIIRRRNDLELRKLELRDKALREDYLGTPRYVEELSALNAEETTLREELGDSTYDLYLYNNGQPNRVKILSVLQGSSAEEAGVKDGDIVLTYNQQRVFEWSELKNATSEGVLGEYVGMDVLRDGQQLSLWLPRGPLGVRLGSARIQP